MPSVSSIRLFDAEPDLARFLGRDDRAAIRQLRMPLLEVPPGDITATELLPPLGAFGALVIDGLLLQAIRLGEHSGLRLVGPGDVLSLSETPPSMLVLDSSCRATVPTRLALLGREFLLACRRWPWLIAGLHARSGDQAERLTTQMMICQLPRVDDRLLAMMWLLSEAWGQVTPSGTVLPLDLTHSALGGLIGARRPTVTLALSELTERGAIVRQRTGWLLLEPPKAPSPAQGEAIGEPRLLAAVGSSSWAEDQYVGQTQGELEAELHHAEIRAAVARLREEHEQRMIKTRENLRRMAAAREQFAQRRARLNGRGRSRQPAPSS